MACTKALCKAVYEAVLEDFLDEMLTGVCDCVFEHCDGCVNQLGNQEGHECLTLSLTDAVRRYTKTVLDKKWNEDNSQYWVNKVQNLLLEKIRLRKKPAAAASVKATEQGHVDQSTSDKQAAAAAAAACNNKAT